MYSSFLDVDDADSFLVGTKMRAKFTNASNGQPICISIRGGFLAHSADLTIGEDGDGPAVARLERRVFSKSEWGGQQTVGVPLDFQFRLQEFFLP